MTQQLFSLAGKKALVTGASRGIGQVIAVAFAEAGADVALTARGADGLAVTAKEIRDAGREAVEIPADLTSHEAAVAVVAEAIDRLGHLDIVVNNAGGSNFLVPFLDTRLSGWEKILRLNLDATMWICQAAGAHMTARGSGSVINVASVAGLAPMGSSIAYAVSKAALIHLTRCMAVALGPEVAVNAVAPGTMLGTRMTARLDPEYVARNLQTAALQRAVERDDVAEQIVAFCKSDSTTGQVLNMDAGKYYP